MRGLLLGSAVALVLAAAELLEVLSVCENCHEVQVARTGER